MSFILDDDMRERLKNLRINGEFNKKNRKMTIEELAKELNFSPTGLGDIERGRNQSIDITTVIRYADYFGVSTDYILGRSGDHKKKSTEELGLALGLNEKSVLALQELKKIKNKDQEEIQSQKANLEIINLFLNYIFDDLNTTQCKKDHRPLFSPLNPIYSYIHSDDGFHMIRDGEEIPVKVVYPTIDGVDPGMTVGELYRARLKKVIIDSIDYFYEKVINSKNEMKKKGGNENGNDKAKRK